MGSKGYVGVSTVKNIEADNEGAVLQVEHFSTLSESLLVYGTQIGRIHCWDLRSRAEAWCLPIDAASGVLTKIAVGPSPYCLIAGTARGYISVWDIRFQLPVHQWRHSSQTAITSLLPVDSSTLLPLRKHNHAQHPVQGPVVLTSAQHSNQLSVFDLYTGDIRTTFRVPTAPRIGTAPATPSLNAVGEGSSSDSSASVSQTSLPSLKSLISPVSSLASPSRTSASALFAAALTGSAAPVYNPLNQQLVNELKSVDLNTTESEASISAALCAKGNFVITGGTDRAIRYWDLINPQESYRISADESSGTIRYQSYVQDSCVVLEETMHLVEGTSNESSAMLLSSRRRGLRAAKTMHRDAITDVKAMEFPQKMLVLFSLF